MDRARVSRYLLFGLLAVAVVWAMWLVPVSQPSTGNAASGSAGNWHLSSISPPANAKKLATRLAKRQGWGAPAGGNGGSGSHSGSGSGGHGGHNNSKKTAAHSKILGITSVDGQPQVVLIHKHQVDTYAPGDTLPDGRRIKAIHGLKVTLAKAANNSNNKSKGGGGTKSKHKGRAKNNKNAASTQTLHLFPYDKSHLGNPKTSHNDKKAS